MRLRLKPAAVSPQIRRILYITMSNLGDAVMALPAFDFLKRECPSARVTVVAAPRTRCLFEHHPGVDELIVFDKHSSLKEKIALYGRLRRAGFDVIVDLKNSFYSWGLKARYKSPASPRYPSWARHDYQRHLLKAAMALRPHPSGPVRQEEFREWDCCRNPSFISRKDTDSLLNLLTGHGLETGNFVLLVPGSRSDMKKWNGAGYAQVAGELQERYRKKVVIAGERSEEPVARQIASAVSEPVIDLCGKTSLGMLCALILRAELVVGSDSGALQIASYLDRPIVGLYGPTDPDRYGPWSSHSIAVRKNVLCAPCSQAACLRRDHACMKTILPYDVLLAVKLILEGKEERFRDRRYRRILVARTDRLGDVLLSTPALRALRDRYPSSFIAVMVSPYTRSLVEGNPYVDEVIVFDKDKEKGLLATLAFSRRLARFSFDLAIVLHPTFRVHLVTFLAGIRDRIGYDWKAPYFLTRALPHRKQEGLKHEMEYNFDLLREAGVDETCVQMHIPLDKASEERMEDFFNRVVAGGPGPVIALNPAASCPSKLWPVEKFARLSDELQKQLGARVLVITDAAHRSISEQLFNLVSIRPVDCSGMFSVSELASLLKRCSLLISNDSGPVHMAVAVGTPVISIFGRNQPGLGPRRWGPVGPRDIALHKPAGCSPCLAHDCQKGFECLASIGIEEVLEHAKSILAESSGQRH
ncbi:MAG: glycosyltransferase family 9 protein [Candidatus Omnitrophota bacterium]